ncbi:MAG: hypothetical protein LBJ10_01625, partial [Clostridiales bacterium]|nr:hypothetical protein [Clostridiales bacterium]
VVEASLASGGGAGGDGGRHAEGDAGGDAGHVASDAAAQAAVDAIGAAVRQLFGAGGPSGGGEAILTNERQHALIQKCLASVRAANAALLRGLPLEMPIIDMEEALAALREISGDAVPDDVADRIFSNFCVGK